MKEIELMQIERISLTKTEYSEDYKTVEFQFVNQSNYCLYPDEDVEVTITKEVAIELIENLKREFNIKDSDFSELNQNDVIFNCDKFDGLFGQKFDMSDRNKVLLDNLDAYQKDTSIQALKWVSFKIWLRDNNYTEDDLNWAINQLGNKND